MASPSPSALLASREYTSVLLGFCFVVDANEGEIAGVARLNFEGQIQMFEGFQRGLRI